MSDKIHFCGFPKKKQETTYDNFPLRKEGREIIGTVGDVLNANLMYFGFLINTYAQRSTLTLRSFFLNFC